jgi:adenylate cyclase
LENLASVSDRSRLVTSEINRLVESGLHGSDVPEVLAGLCRRLNAGGIPIDRAGCAIPTLHPQIVSHQFAWYSHDDRTTTRYFTSEFIEDPKNHTDPYFQLALNRLTYKRFRIGGAARVEDASLLARLQSEGYAEYFGFFHATGGSGAISPVARRIGLVPCVVGSFATRRPGGFEAAEIDCLKPLSKTIGLTVKAWTNHDTASRLLDLYVGRSCGSRVLEGQITRGDSELISCGIWFCDLRRSSRLVSQLPLEDYIALLNRYFDATASAVMAAGGEVLKFIGDAVMGIFRSDRPGEDVAMRERALSAASKAQQNIRELHALGRPLEVGIALHVGEVMFGNVGTDERLDFTVIGRAVNEVARLQDLTKQLGHPVLASASFVEPIRQRFHFVGANPVAGFDEILESYTPRV